MSDNLGQPDAVLNSTEQPANGKNATIAWFAGGCVAALLTIMVCSGCVFSVVVSQLSDLYEKWSLEEDRSLVKDPPAPTVSPPPVETEPPRTETDRYVIVRTVSAEDGHSCYYRQRCFFLFPNLHNTCRATPQERAFNRFVCTDGRPIGGDGGRRRYYPSVALYRSPSPLGGQEDRYRVKRSR